MSYQERVYFPSQAFGDPERTGIYLDGGLLPREREISRAFSSCIGWCEKLRLESPQINGHYFLRRDSLNPDPGRSQRTRPKVYKKKQSETSHHFTVFRGLGKGTKTKQEPQS